MYSLAQNILLSFLIGSCYFVCALFFRFVYRAIDSKEMNMDTLGYHKYTLNMPVVFGIINVVMYYLQVQLKFTDIVRFTLSAIIPAVAINIMITIIDLYKYNQIQWNTHYFIVFMGYLTAWVGMIMPIEKFLRNRKFSKYEFYVIAGVWTLFIVNLFVNKQFTTKFVDENSTMDDILFNVF
jgi:hypothetical protein